MEKVRKSNIELLRIIAMLLIICFHYVFKSGYNFTELNYNSFIVKAFYLVGELGVNIFILITGYFLVEGKFSGKKLIKLILEVNFYYIISLIILNAINSEGYGLVGIAKKYIVSLPTIFNKYWFFTVYILLYILSPYLNIFIHNVKQKDFQKLLIILILIWSVIPTVFGLRMNNTEKLLYFNRFIWAIIIYLIGAYMRLYPIKFLEKNHKRPVLIAMFSFAIMLLGIIVIYTFKNLFQKIGTTEVAYFWRPNTLPMLLLSISVFKIFVNLKMKSNKIINTLASTTLGVYLIHDGPLSSYIWTTIFNSKVHLNSNFSIVYIVATSIVIFLVCATIDLLRQLLEKHTVTKLLAYSEKQKKPATESKKSICR